MEKPNWYQIEVDKVVEILETDLSRGLDETKVKEKRVKFGLNELVEEPGKPLWAMFLGQFKEFLVILKELDN